MITTILTETLKVVDYLLSTLVEWITPMSQFNTWVQKYDQNCLVDSYLITISEEFIFCIIFSDTHLRFLKINAIDGSINQGYRTTTTNNISFKSNNKYVRFLQFLNDTTKFYFIVSFDFMFLFEFRRLIRMIVDIFEIIQLKLTMENVFNTKDEKYLSQQH